MTEKGRQSQRNHGWIEAVSPPTETLKRRARAKQAELARCDDPHRRVLLLQERNALLAQAKAAAQGAAERATRSMRPSSERDEA